MLTRRTRGFSLVELVIAISLMGILMTLAMPAFRTWIRNAQVRAVSDSLQSGARLAQAAAINRYRQAVFFRTNDSACNDDTKAADGGAFWVVRTVAAIASDPVETLQCGVLSDVASGVSITGPTAICFNSGGRQAANPNPGIGGAACVLAETGLSSYDITQKDADRPLRVLVTLAGSVRMCDPARTFSATAPDGCPA